MELFINMKKTDAIVDLVMDDKELNEWELTYIEWEDAIAHTGWMSESEGKKWFQKQTMTVKQVGWVVTETQKYLGIVSRMSDWGEGERELGQLQKIPKTWIRRRVLLTDMI